MEKENIILHTVEHYTVFKNENPTTHDNMGKTEGHFTK